MKLLFLNSIFLTFITFAQTGPAGVCNNIGTSPLVVWLDAEKNVFESAKTPAIENSRIKIWEDLSGHNNHFSSGADSTRPSYVANNQLLNGHSTVLFAREASASNNRNYLLSNSFIKTSDITMYCVFHPLLPAGGNGVSPFQYKGYSPNLWYYGAGLLDAGMPASVNDVCLAFCDTNLTAGSGDNTTSTDYTVKIPAGLNKSYFGVLQKEAWNGLLSVSKNGEMFTSYQAGIQSVTSPTNFYLGTTADLKSKVNNTFFDGHIASVLVFNKVLSQAETIILNNYISAKYNIKLSNNDFYTLDEPTAGNFDFELAGIGKASDGSQQLIAQGEGILTVSSTDITNNGSFLIWGHNGNSMIFEQNNNLPEGVFAELDRKWGFSNTANLGEVSLSFDVSWLDNDLRDRLVLMIDQNNNATFADEKIGEGIFFQNKSINTNKCTFNNITISDKAKLTLAILKPKCEADCDDAFSPNADGIADTYYIATVGKVHIYNKFGEVVKTVQGPTFWDGLTNDNKPAQPGLYFLSTNDKIVKSITLVK